jgi:hypothetical protein
MDALLNKLEGIDLNPAIDRWTTEIWGQRCPEYEALCPCCVAWELRDSTGLRPKFKQVMAQIELNRGATA